MKFVPPYGREAEGDSAQYVNGDPSIGRQGSIPPANAFEHPMREIVAVISKSVMTPTDTDLIQMTKAVRSQRLNYCEDTGSANMLSAAFDPPLSDYTLGFIIRVHVRNTNNGPCTIDAGAGRVPVIRPNGAALAANDLNAGQVAELVFDGANFQLVNFGGGGIGGSTTINYATLPYTVDTGTVNAIVANFTPAITTQAAGTAFLVRISNTNTGATTIAVNGLPTKSVRANVDASNLLPGDVSVGGVVLFVFDGSNYYITPNPLIPTSCTLNVPSLFATPQAALAALSRKTIGYAATVTIKLAAGVYPGYIDFYHKDGDRIILQGTMLAASPAYGNFSQSGNTPAARAQDAANNIAMLRSRYGTEIAVVATYDAPSNSYQSYGVRNLGPGAPVVQDMLFTGNTKAFMSVGIWGTAGPPPNKTLSLANVAIWGFNRGLWTAAAIDLRNCSATNCVSGMQIENHGSLYTSGSIFCSNDSYGVACASHAFADIQGCNVNYNGYVGIYASDGSGIRFEASSVSGGNASADAVADVGSQISVAAGCLTNTHSPPPFVIGNYNALIVKF